MGVAIGLQALSVITGQQVEALDSRSFNRAVHAPDLVIGPGVGRPGEPMRHAVFAADTVNTVFIQQRLVRAPLSVSAAGTLQGGLVSTRRRNSAATTRLARGISRRRLPCWCGQRP